VTVTVSRRADESCCERRRWQIGELAKAGSVVVRVLPFKDGTTFVLPISEVTRVRTLVGALLLILGGGLACAYGTLILASIDTSDTATGSLVAFGLTFALPGVAAVVAGAWLLHRR
jgi:hypothetical protein